MNSILLIEDDKKKIADIVDYFNNLDSKLVLAIKESYQSGLRSLLGESFDLLLLDMSIPTWDNSKGELNSNFEKFGGYKILKELQRKRKQIPTILITMFDNFGESDSSMTLNELDKILKIEFGNSYCGVVFYSARENNWKEQLKHLLTSIA
jgi:CheY-like chemotaxis protein